MSDSQLREFVTKLRNEIKKLDDENTVVIKSGLSSLEDYRYHVGRSHTLAELFDLVAEEYRKLTKDL